MASAKQYMVSAVFRDHVQSQRAYQWLLDQGYNSSDINVLMSDRTRAKHYREDEEAPKQKPGNAAVEGAGIGGAIGTIVGGSIAAVAAIGTSLAVPGLGLVIAGPIAAALAGAGAGGITGGLIGGLIGLGITESNAKAYEEALREGGVVIGVVPRTGDDGRLIKEYLEENGGENVCYC